MNKNDQRRRRALSRRREEKTDGDGHEETSLLWIDAPFFARMNALLEFSPHPIKRIFSGSAFDLLVLTNQSNTDPE